MRMVVTDKRKKKHSFIPYMFLCVQYIAESVPKLEIQQREKQLKITAIVSLYSGEENTEDKQDIMKMHSMLNTQKC